MSPRHGSFSSQNPPAHLANKPGERSPWVPALPDRFNLGDITMNRKRDLSARYAVFVPILLATVAVAALGWREPGWAFLLIVLLPLACLGIWDVFQRRHTLMRNYPVTAHFRWLLEDLRPFLRQYIVEGDLTGRPFNREQRSLVYE